MPPLNKPFLRVDCASCCVPGTVLCAEKQDAKQIRSVSQRILLPLQRCNAATSSDMLFLRNFIGT